MKPVRKRTIRLMMGLYVFFTFLLGATFPVMPFSAVAQSNIPVIVVGAVFWVGFLFSLLFLVLTLVKYKKWRKQDNGDELPKKKLPGVLRFFRSTYASIADGVFLASTISFVVLMFTKYSNAYVVYILLFLMIVSFSLHSILNGNIYNEIKNKKLKGRKRYE
ncbi:MAG: hypothetical protein E7530_03725 [Ruminococcaceae bacterium]|nr:hypothetical protein [Oscillospiraceae bacterium]